jgi:hypothetical protein
MQIKAVYPSNTCILGHKNSAVETDNNKVHDIDIWML